MVERCICGSPARGGQRARASEPVAARNNAIGHRQVSSPLFLFVLAWCSWAFANPWCLFRSDTVDCKVWARQPLPEMVTFLHLANKKKQKWIIKAYDSSKERNPISTILSNAACMRVPYRPLHFACSIAQVILGILLHHGSSLCYLPRYHYKRSYLGTSICARTPVQNLFNGS
jgi:hypothetical protein